MFNLTVPPIGRSSVTTTQNTTAGGEWGGGGGVFIVYLILFHNVAKHPISNGRFMLRKPNIYAMAAQDTNIEKYRYFFFHEKKEKAFRTFVLLLSIALTR